MRLIEALQINGANPEESEGRLSVALVCGFTPLHLQTFLTAELRLAFPSHHIDVTVGEYDNIARTLHDVRERRWDAIVFVLEWPDLDPRLGTRQLGGWSAANLPDVIERARVRLDQFSALLQNQPAPVILSLPTLPLPPLFHTAGWQASIYELHLREAVLAFASRLAQVRVISEQRLNVLSPPSERHDVRSNWLNGFPYHGRHASALAQLLCQAIRNVQPKKGIITDLDNTLWRGIVGEEGSQCVSWDLDHHAQGHGVYQQFLSALADEGVLVAVASKNDPPAVREAFARSDILLSAEKVYPFEVSWGSKAEAISRVLAAWNIAADDVTFVDDDPLELANVKAAHPSLECVQFPTGDPEAIDALIVRLRDAYGRNQISYEDTIRRESLRARGAASPTDGGEAFSEALLEDAGGEVMVRFSKEPVDGRALELINKTNQFNLNGKRVTEAMWRDYLEAGDAFLLTSTYKDKFGVLGEIAVMAGRFENGKQAAVDTWVMSCRAFGRRIEHHCLKFLFDKTGAERIRFAYEPTARNKPITRCLTELLDSAPAPAAVLTVTQFEARCPKLFHHVVERQ